jgi:hypothetical protein
MILFWIFNSQDFQLWKKTCQPNEGQGQRYRDYTDYTTRVLAEADKGRREGRIVHTVKLPVETVLDLLGMEGLDNTPANRKSILLREYQAARAPTIDPEQVPLWQGFSPEQRQELEQKGLLSNKKEKGGVT